MLCRRDAPLLLFVTECGFPSVSGGVTIVSGPNHSHSHMRLRVLKRQGSQKNLKKNYSVECQKNLQTPDTDGSLGGYSHEKAHYEAPEQDCEVIHTPRRLRASST